MTESNPRLGKLVAVYALAPAHVQSAIFIAVLSFLFFLAMMFAYYIRQNALYFLLATAFLIVYLVTLFSWVMQRRLHLQIFERGFRYKKLAAVWAEIEEISDDGVVLLADGRRTIISPAIYDFRNAITMIREKARTV